MSIRPWRDIERRKSRQIMVGSVPVGGDAPISVQTMTNTPTEDAKATIDQIRRCEEAGADIIRVSCPTAEATAALKEIVRAASVPIVADIHFHYKRALEAADAGAACLRINPGNIGSEERVREVIAAAKANGCAIRIGVNAGSLEKDLLEKYGEPCPEALVESALDHIRILEDHDFREYKVAVKASDVFLAVAAYMQLATEVDCPLHLGITEAGGSDRRHGQVVDRHGQPAVGRDRRHHSRVAVRGARGGSPRRLRNPEGAWHPQPRRPRRLLPQLRAPGLRRDPHGRGARSAAPAHQDADVAFSVLGCVVNGPGEARETDIGITGGGNGKHMVYLSGVTDHHVQDADMIDHIVRLVEAKAAEIEAEQHPTLDAAE